MPDINVGDVFVDPSYPDIRFTVIGVAENEICCRTTAPVLNKFEIFKRNQFPRLYGLVPYEEPKYATQRFSVWKSPSGTYLIRSTDLPVHNNLFTLIDGFSIRWNEDKKVTIL